MDEGLSLERAANNPFDGVITIGDRVITDCTPPIYYALLAFDRLVGGDSVFSLRMVSVWASMVGVALVYALGRRLYGRNAGWSAMLMASISPYWIWHTQAALPDSAMIAATLLSILSLERITGQGKQHSLWGVVWFISTVAMLYTQQTALWILAFEIPVGIIASFKRRNHKGVLVWVLLVLAASLPLIYSAIGGAEAFPVYRPAWYQARQIALGSGSTRPVWVGVFRVLPFSLLLFASPLWFFFSPSRRRQWLFGIGFFLVPVAAAQLITRDFGVGRWPMVWTLLISSAFIIAGAGFSALWRRSRSFAFVIVLGVVAISGQWLFIQITNPTFGRDGLRAAAGYVSTMAEEGDVVILHDAMALPVWRYYYKGPAPVEVIPEYGGEKVDIASGRMNLAALTHRRVWYLQQPAPWAYFDPSLLPYYASVQWVQFDDQDFSSPWLQVHLAGYTVEPPVVKELPAGATPVDICWPGGLCVVGWSTTSLVPGETAELNLFWLQKKPTDNRLRAQVMIRAGDGSTWTELSEQILRFYPVARWPTGEIIQQTIRFSLSPAMPPTTFNLDLALAGQPNKGAIKSKAGKTMNQLGTITIQRPTEPIKPDAIQLQYKNDADFGETVRLLGFNLPIDRPRPGHTTFVDFYWQALKTPTENWRQWVRLEDRDGKVWVDHVGPLTVIDFDMLQWQVGDLIWGHIFIPLPGQMPAGEYRLVISLLDSNGDPVPAMEIWRAEPTDSVVAGPVYLANWPILSSPPPVPHRPDIVFDNAIRLWGYDIPGKMTAGSELTVSIVWQCERPLEDDFNVFIHLMGENDTLLGQADGVPVDWTRPTSSWRAGEFIVDNYSIPIPEDAPEGPADVWIGFYRPDGSGRLPLSNFKPGQPEDRALIDFVIIEH